MKKILLTLTAVLFFLWILPLGFVIKPAFEKIACDGQRALCMCSHLTMKQTGANPGKTCFQANTGAQQAEPKKSGGTGSFFLLAQTTAHVINKFCSHLQNTPTLYSFRLTPRIEHIPKI